MASFTLRTDDAARAAVRAFASHIGREPFDEDRDLPSFELAGGVYIVDANHRLVHMNSTAADIVSVDARDAIGHHCREVFRCIICPTPCPLFASGAVRHREVVLDGRARGHATVLKNADVLLDDSGRLVGGLEVLQDVTAFRAVQERELRRVAGDAELLVEALRAGLERPALVATSTGAVAALTRAAAAMLGVEPTTGSLEVADLVTLDEGVSPLKRALAAEVPVVLPAKRPHRENKPILLRLTPLSRRNSRHRGALILLDEPVGDLSHPFHGILGRSRAVRELTDRIAAFARSGAAVLVMGESGSGKELVARALHDAGPRAGRPFHAVNCAAISDTLLESELFGHERGAFTDAVRNRLGRLEAAADGTLFLDEIASLSPRLQAKLLRVLETRDFEPVGSTHSKRFRARVVAATNSDLTAMVREGTFRADLLFRLNALTIMVPPLRDRREDIPLLARHFGGALAVDEGLPIPIFDEDALHALEDYGWPGNVRELRNAIQHATIVAHGGRISRRDLPQHISSLESIAPGAVSRRRIEEALQQSAFNRAAAAALLGVSRTTLWRRMRQLGMV